MATAPVTTTSVDMPQVDPASTDMSWLPTPQVYGENPQAMSLDQIIGQIQSQYTPMQLPGVDNVSYGAGRFIDGQPLGLNFDSQMPSWFKQGEFDINAYRQVMPEEVQKQIAEGTVYGGGSPVDAVTSGSSGDSGIYDPYAAFGKYADSGSLLKGLGLFSPLAGMIAGGARGYDMANASNALNTLMGAYGGETNEGISPWASAALGTIGITPDSVKTNAALMSQFNNDPAKVAGYFAASTDPSISQIFDSLAKDSPVNLTPAQVGELGQNIGEKVNSYVAKGYSLNNAVQQTAQDYGIARSESAAIAANLNTQDPLGQLINNLTQDVAPAAGVDGRSYNSSTGSWDVVQATPVYTPPPVVATPLPPVVATPLPPVQSSSGSSGDSFGYNNSSDYGGYGYGTGYSGVY